jgi:tetratricopeptide (TPR) repeat protein
MGASEQPLDPEIERLSEKLAKDPKSLVFAQLADAYRRSNLVDEAIQIVKKGLEIHPDYSSAHIVLGCCYRDKRMYELAREEFERVLERDPQNLKALRLGRKEEGMEKYQILLDIDPFNKEGKELLEQMRGDAPVPQEETAYEQEEENEKNEPEGKSNPEKSVEFESDLTLSDLESLETSSEESVEEKESDLEPHKEISGGVENYGDLSLSGEQQEGEVEGGAGTELSNQELDSGDSFQEKEASVEISSQGDTVEADFSSQSLEEISLSDIEKGEEETALFEEEEKKEGEDIPPEPDISVDEEDKKVEDLSLSPEEGIDMKEVEEDKEEDISFLLEEGMTLAEDEMNEEVSFASEEGLSLVEEGGKEEETSHAMKEDPFVLPQTQPSEKPFLTETIADIYEKQGFADKALKIYKKLLEDDPDNEKLKMKIKTLEEGTSFLAQPIDSPPSPESGKQFPASQSTDVSISDLISDKEQKPPLLHPSKEEKETFQESDDKTPGKPQRKAGKEDAGEEEEEEEEEEEYESFQDWLKGLKR